MVVKKIHRPPHPSQHTLRRVLKAAVSDGAEELGLEAKVAEGGVVEADVGALGLGRGSGGSRRGGGLGKVILVQQILSGVGSGGCGRDSRKPRGGLATRNVRLGPQPWLRGEKRWWQTMSHETF